MLEFIKRSLMLRVVASYGAVFVAGLIVVGLFCTARVETLADDTVDAYGSTVAAQLAQNALDAVMQRDQISLQAQLSRLMKVPGIVSAGIYDAKNELLAQAGATPSELAHRHYLHHYSTTLGLGDNMTGSVVVTLETPKSGQLLTEIRWLLIAVAVAVLSLLFLLSRYFTREIKYQRAALAAALLDKAPSAVIDTCFSERPAQLNEHDIHRVLNQLQDYVQQVKTPTPADLHHAASALFNSHDGYVYLLLECHNLDVLLRQVSRGRLRTLLDDQQQYVEKTARLYNAQRMPTLGACIKIAIPTDNAQLTDVLLRAACCAYVLQGVLMAHRDEDSGIQLQWSLALDRHQPSDNDILRNCQWAQDEQRSRWLCRQVGHGQLAVSAELGALLQEQDKLILAVEHGEGGKPFHRIDQFAQNQRALLSSQIAFLLGH